MAQPISIGMIAALQGQVANLTHRIALLEESVDMIERAWPEEEVKEPAARKSKPATDAGKIKKAPPPAAVEEKKELTPPTELALDFTLPKKYTVFGETRVPAVKKYLKDKAPNGSAAFIRLPRKINTVAVLLKWGSNVYKFLLVNGPIDYEFGPDKKTVEAYDGFKGFTAAAGSSLKTIIDGFTLRTHAVWLTEKILNYKPKSPTATPIKRSHATMNGHVSTRPRAPKKAKKAEEPAEPGAPGGSSLPPIPEEKEEKEAA